MTAQTYAPLPELDAPELFPNLSDALDFHLPPELEAREPPEARGLDRDQVRLLVSYASDDQIFHTTFRTLPEFLKAGDVVVINTSATVNAALPATRTDGPPLALHLSTRLPADMWIVEVRQPHGRATRPFYRARAGETLSLPQGGSATLHTPYRPDQRDQGRAYRPAAPAHRRGQPRGPRTSLRGILPRPREDGPPDHNTRPPPGRRRCPPDRLPRTPGHPPGHAPRPGRPGPHPPRLQHRTTRKVFMARIRRLAPDTPVN